LCSLSIKVAGDERVLVANVAKAISVPALKQELLRRWQEHMADLSGAVQAAALPAAQVRLIFAGRLLEDDKTFEEQVQQAQNRGAGAAGAAYTIHMVLPAPDISEIERLAAQNLEDAHTSSATPGDTAAEEEDEAPGAGTARASHAGAKDAVSGDGRGASAGAGRGRESRQEKKSQELRIPCDARYYRGSTGGGWCRAERGARVSATEVNVYFSNSELPTDDDGGGDKGAGGGSGKRRGVTAQVTKEVDVKLRPYWWRALKEEDMISLEPLNRLKYEPFELAAGADLASNSYWYIHTYIHTYIHIYIHTYNIIYAHYIYIYIYVYIYIYMYIYIYIYMQV
jgi:hypothetical protein